jgi:DNA-binding response OmpR family regulator
LAIKLHIYKVEVLQAERETMKGGEKLKPILIVEDEAVMRESLQDWLTESGYQVETAEEGEEALKTIAEQDFGIVILDLRLPGKDGVEVLRKAKVQKPELNGIIITAYPSIESAVEAMKIGAIDYLPKPFDLNDLEKLIRETLGPVQVEIRPKAIPEAIAEPAIVEEVKIEEVIAIAPEEVLVHLKQGKAHFEAGRYAEALKEFESVLKVAPGNIETRVWLRKTNEVLTKPEVEVVAEEVKPRYCVWMSLGMVSYRICTNNYDCMNCEFDQEMQEKMAAGETPELDEALARFKELPGSQRLCRYALKGDVSYRLCTRLFQCATCEFGQMMDDDLQQKLVQRAAELAARQEALRKKEQSWWWSYWG